MNNGLQRELNDAYRAPDIPEIMLGDPAVKEQRMPYRIAKRCFDVILSALAIVVMTPVMLLIGILIKLDSEGPAVFIHWRYGKNGKPLPLIKFRSMHLDAQNKLSEFTPEQRAEWEENFKVTDDPRITRMGRILRKTSFDEIPQLFNIIKGDLSFVGPRPIITEELERYGEYKEKFLSVMPGLTGYWQAYARSDCSYEQRMAMELYYVDHANMLWDIRIMLATFGAVLRGRGAK